MHDILVSFGMFMYLCFSEGKDLYVASGETFIEFPILFGAESFRIPGANGEGYVGVAVCLWGLC